MYIIMEIQTSKDGQVSTLVQTVSGKNQAESVYYQILSFAAISSVYKHSCVLLTEDGEYVVSECFYHGEEQEENNEG